MQQALQLQDTVHGCRILQQQQQQQQQQGRMSACQVMQRQPAVSHVFSVVTCILHKLSLNLTCVQRRRSGLVQHDELLFCAAAAAAAAVATCCCC
jgi:hypothetical protein